MEPSFFEHLSHIRLIALDVDGVLTDNTLLCTEDGHLLRAMNTRDGYAMATAHKAGIRLVIITGGSSTGVLSRLNKLGIADVFSGIQDKRPVLEQYCREKGFAPEETLYMGDDIPDYEVMQWCGTCACPNDAVPEIKSIARYICNHKGGHGCVREILELVLKQQDKWFNPQI